MVEDRKSSFHHLSSKIMKTLYQKLSTHEIVQVLSNPAYFSFTLSVLFSSLAFNITSIVFIFLLFSLTSSNFSVSMLLITILVPQIFISFIGGIVADLKNKKLILIHGNLLRGIILFLLFMSPNNVVLIYIGAALVSTITQFYVPAEAPLIPRLVKKNCLLAANSIFSMCIFGSILIGYVLAGPALSALGRSHTYLFLAGLFFISTLFAAFIPKTQASGADMSEGQIFSFHEFGRSIRQELGKSYVLLRGTAEVGSAFFLLISSQVIILILATLVPGYAKTILQVPVEDLSILLFAPAALGMVVSSLLMGSLFHKISRNKLMNVGVFVSGIVLLLFPFTSRFVVGALNKLLPNPFTLDAVQIAVALAFLAGFSNALIFVPSQAIIQETTPANFRSKIYGLLFAFIGVFSLIPIIIAGTVADTAGVGGVFIGIGVVIIVVGAVRVATAWMQKSVLNKIK